MKKDRMNCGTKVLLLVLFFGKRGLRWGVYVMVCMALAKGQICSFCCSLVVDYTLRATKAQFVNILGNIILW